MLILGKADGEKEERRKKQEERDAFFAEVQSGYEDTTGGRWLQNTLKEHTTGYEICSSNTTVLRKFCGKF